MRVVIAGLGTVGKGLLKALSKKQIELRRAYGFSPKVVAAVKSDGAFLDENGLDPASVLSSLDGRSYEEHSTWVSGYTALEAVRDLDFDVLVEATPTNVESGEPGLSHILAALEREKDVVTSNKGPLVVAFEKLMEVARERGRILRYEATVGGAMPVFSLVEKCLRGNKITAIKGILNGTTNYILTRMTYERVPFDIALKEAQELGYAEANPSFDIEGIDAACKLVILANAIMSMRAKLSDVEIVGITRITPEAIELAREDGYLVKHVAQIEEGVLEVSPRLVDEKSPLAVGGTLNVVSVSTDLAGEFTVIGRGAGEETVSAVLNDLIDIWLERRRALAK